MKQFYSCLNVFRRYGFGVAALLLLTALACQAPATSSTSMPPSVPAESPIPAPSPTSAPPVPSPSSGSDNRPVDSTAVVGALQEIVKGLYREVNPSVVHIRVGQEVDRSFSLPGQRGDGQGGPVVPRGEGSGFVWDNQGHIITNNHVVAGADRITVIFYDGRQVQGEVIGTDPDSDLAVVKVDLPADGLHPVEVADSRDVEVGQLVAALGNPFGLEGTLTVGFVSATGRTLPVERQASGGNYSIPDVIQTDAAINPGNSGGVLIDDRGRLVGVTTAIISPSRSSAGVGFAVPSVIVQKVVPALISEGSYAHPWVGISGTSMTPRLAEEMELDRGRRGALVIEVLGDSPADEAGLQGGDRRVVLDGREVLVGGDIITDIDGRPVAEFDDLVTHLARYTEVGQAVTLTVLRDGEEREIELILGARP